MSGLRKENTNWPTTFYAQCSRVTCMRDTKLRKGLRPTSAMLATALYFSSAPCQLWGPAKTNFILKFLLPDVSIFTTGEIDTRLLLSACGSGRSWVSSVSCRHRLLSSPLGCWGQTHIGNFCTGTREGRSPSSAPLSLMHSSVRRKGTALAWCWLF